MFCFCLIKPNGCAWQHTPDTSFSIVGCSLLPIIHSTSSSSYLGEDIHIFIHYIDAYVYRFLYQSKCCFNVLFVCWFFWSNWEEIRKGDVVVGSLKAASNKLPKKVPMVLFCFVYSVCCWRPVSQRNWLVGVVGRGETTCAP